MITRKKVFVSSMLLVSLLFQGAAQQPGSVEQSMAQLTGSVLIEGRSMDYLKDLSDKFGGRLTGSPAYRRAAEWAVEQFKAAGIKDARLESFEMPNGWERGWARGLMISPMERALHIESMGWSPSTPPEGVKGEVVVISDVSPDKIKAQADKLKGRIVMLDLSVIFAQGLEAFGRVLAAPALLKEAGAQAIIWPNQEPNNVLNAFGLTWGGRATSLPAAQLGMEDVKLIKRLLEKGAVTIEFQYENRLTGPMQVDNVVAEIRGREKPDEWILIGAHLDSWDYGTGAQDNGAGCAMVLEAARAIAKLEQPPRRSVRFALWGGEEQGLAGSTAYARAHSSELAKCVAVLNTDNGAGHPRGWKVEGREDLSEALKTISKSLTGLGGQGISMELTFDTDHGPFMLEGIPALDLWVDMTHYNEVHHKSSDTLDKVDAHNLAAGAAIIAATAYAIAERPEPIAPRINRDAVLANIKKAKQDGFMRAVGVLE